MILTSHSLFDFLALGERLPLRFSGRSDLLRRDRSLSFSSRATPGGSEAERKQKEKEKRSSRKPILVPMLSSREPVASLPLAPSVRGALAAAGYASCADLEGVSADEVAPGTAKRGERLEKRDWRRERESMEAFVFVGLSSK